MAVKKLFFLHDKGYFFKHFVFNGYDFHHGLRNSMIMFNKLLLATFLSALLLFPHVLKADSSTRTLVSFDPPQPVRFCELGFQSGYVWGELKHKDNLEIIPFSARLGFDINELVGMKGPNMLQLGVEPFVNTILAPENGIEAGLQIGLRYIASLNEFVSVFGEISSGPTYFGIDTFEQGDYRFNFLSRFSTGLDFAVTRLVSLQAGYRFRHLSNAKLSTPNAGINSNAFFTGISFKY